MKKLLYIFAALVAVAAIASCNKENPQPSVKKLTVVSSDLNFNSAGGSGTGLGNFLFNIGVIAFVAVVFFHLITLPVEFNASNRAIKLIREYQLVDGDEINGARRVLRAAAMTYVAALASAVANLIRILLIRGRN